MHHVLQIEEILLNIFGHCYAPYTPVRDSNLATLARTCCTFKEPALNVLWEELHSLSPLARCVPEVSYISTTNGDKDYSFSRSLTQSEWDILRSYTRRIRSISTFFDRGLDFESVRTLSKPPTAEPIFPNVHYLYCGYHKDDKVLLLLPFPSLICFKIMLYDREEFEDSLRLFSKTCPNLAKLSICRYQWAFFKSRRIKPDFICWWQNLRSVDCFGLIQLDVETLLCLSLMPTLTRLSFKLSKMLLNQIFASNSSLIFPSLHELLLFSKSLPRVSRLLSQVQLPTITELRVIFGDQPFKQGVFSFFSILQESGIGHTIHELGVSHQFDCTGESDSKQVLVMEDLEPCMAFTNLRHMAFDVGWKVDLTDSKLLMLVSAWPQLEHLRINKEWGWRSVGGVTPNGWLQLLRKCPSLCQIALAIDTRGYIEVPQIPEYVGMNMPPKSQIDIVDSIIDEESVPAIAAFFAGIAPHSSIFFRAWWRRDVCVPLRDTYKARWEDVRIRSRMLSSSLLNTISFSAWQ